MEEGLSINKNLLDTVLGEFKIPEAEINQFSPLVLAYIGDTVYEIFIRTMVVRKGNAPMHRIHAMAVRYVKAKAQSDVIHRIQELLTPEEADIVRRGRNAKSGTIPKNADVTEYKYATGFESLLGYLYLKGEHDRLMHILRQCVED